jgi:hypothetical protein
MQDLCGIHAWNNQKLTVHYKFDSNVTLDKLVRHKLISL